MLDLTDPSAIEPGVAPALPKTSPRLASSLASPTRVEVPCASMAEAAAGFRPAFVQARSTARRWPTGLGAVIPLPLPSLEPPRPRSTAYTRSPSRSASSSRLRTNRAAPSPITKPSAPASNGRVPVAERAPILQNFTKPLTPMLRSTPPVTTASKSPLASPCTAMVVAASPDAHAASVVKFGPRKSNRLAIRPASTLDSSPGMVSSVMSSSWARNRSCHSARIAERASAGSDAKAGVCSRSRRNSGNRMRSEVR